jgi:UDP-glucuronate 4-epimerase
MNVLITGAAGFIGFHLSAYLLKKKYSVLGLDNLNSYYSLKLKKDRLKILSNFKNFKFYKIDLSNKQKLFKELKRKKIDIVVNLAAQAGVRYSLQNPDEYLKSNLVGFCNLLNLVKDKKIKHFLFASSSSVYGKSEKKKFNENDPAIFPIQFYAATKRSNEIIAHSYSYIYKIPATGLRFFTVYGPWGRPDMALFKFTKNIINGKKIDVFNYGKHKRDFTYIDDVIKSIYLLLKKIPKKNKKQNLSNSKDAPFEIINIGGGEKVKLMNFIEEIENNIKKKAKINYLPLQKGDVLETSCDTKKIKNYLNFIPKTNYKTGIKKFIDWYIFYFKK